VSLSSIEDGLADTVAIIEADDEAAVPWTRPADLDLALDELHTKVGHLREDGFFVTWFDGSVGRILSDCSVADLRAVFTCDAGDAFATNAVRAEATAAPAALPFEADTVQRVALGGADQTPANDPAVATARHKPGIGPPAAPRADRPMLLPIPDPVSMEQARQLVRDLYQEQYESQTSPLQQRAVAQKMLNQAGEMEDDPAGRYVLLDVALKIAQRTGDAVTALSAVEQLVEDYAVDELKLTHDALKSVVGRDRSSESCSRVVAKACRLIDRAIQEEQFETAESLCEIATASARQLGDRNTVNQLVQMSARVAYCSQEFREVQRVLKSAKTADDPAGNLRVGRYYCLVRGQWDEGVPLLAQSNDPHLRELAELELRNPTIPADQLVLADGWWELAAVDQTQRAAYCRRAAYWYARALPELPTGLWRAKADMRLKECRRLYGPLDTSGVGQ